MTNHKNKNIEKKYAPTHRVGGGINMECKYFRSELILRALQEVHNLIHEIFAARK